MHTEKAARGYWEKNENFGKVAKVSKSWLEDTDTHTLHSGWKLLKNIILLFMNVLGEANSVCIFEFSRQKSALQAKKFWDSALKIKIINIWIFAPKIKILK